MSLDGRIDCEIYFVIKRRLVRFWRLADQHCQADKMELSAMSQGQQIEAAFLTACKFFRHPDNPAVGILRLDTETQPLWILVTHKDLLSLAEICVKHADDLIQAQ